MAFNYFYKDRSGAQNGPVSLEELTALASAGRIAPDCLVWFEGGEPAQAASYEALASAFLHRVASGGASGFHPLQPAFPVWGLFWRGIVFVLGVALVIPAPWVGVWFYRWLAGHISLPGGERLSLATSVGECWYIFAGLGLIGYFEPASKGSGVELWVALLTLFVNVWLAVELIRWFCRSLRAEQGGLSVNFSGGFWAYFGWYMLIVVSVLTLVGWAWALKYQMRWICRQVGGSHSFEFVGTGLDFLWRTLVLAIACGLLLPLPWALRWFAHWFVSRIVATPGLANAQRIAA